MKIPVAVLAVMMALIAFSGVSPAAAYNSSVDAVCELTTVIVDTIGEITEGKDVESHSIITNASSDSHEYDMVPTTDNGHPASVITAVENPTTDSNIVEKGESFNISVTVPKGIKFYLVVELSSVFAQNRININCSSPSCSISWTNSNGGTHYIGMVGSSLSDVSSGEDNWIYSETSDITIQLDGRRGTAFGQNWGGMKVTLVMQETN